jgi:lipopolysaccharide/colanic/teichoic acid biosynthesis glycosyltransferase
MRAFSLVPANTLVVLIGDLLLCTGIYLGSLYLLLPFPVMPYLVNWNGWLRVLLGVLSVLGGLYFNELYTGLRVPSRVALVLQLSHVFGVSLVAQTMLAYLNENLALPRRVLLAGTVLGLPAFFFWRVLFSGFLWKLFGQQTVLLVGSGALAQELTRRVREKPERGVGLMGYVGSLEPEKMQAAHLGPFDQLSSIVTELKPDRVVVACSERRDGGMPVEQLLKLRRRAIPIEEGASLYELLCRRICSSEFRPSQFIFDQTLVHRPGSLALQSVYINVLALCGIVVTLPILLVLAVLVRVSTGGPILHSVTCTGYRGIPFTLKRFRVTRKAPGSNRLVLTRLGRFLRGTHLDLLPALFNLLRGEMALVGPCPHCQEMEEELSSRIPFYEQRYALRPGLTGWSQINMDTERSSGDALIALEYDLYYLKNMSLSLDAYILLHRLRQTLTIR